MKIPRFWSRGTAEGKTLRGRDAAFSCWRSSDTSEADARVTAMMAARRVLDAFISGHEPNRYEYGCVPLREEVMNKTEDEQGNTVAVVTRNRYGSLVLNAERAMFVDIDFPPVATGETTKHLLGRLLGRAKASPEAQR